MRALCNKFEQRQTQLRRCPIWIGGAESCARANYGRPPDVNSVIRLPQGLRQRLMQTEVALREAQAKKDAEAVSCAAMAERLQAGACVTHSM